MSGSNCLMNRKTFTFEDSNESLEVIIKESAESDYSMFVWPSAPLLSQFIFLNRSLFSGKLILEIGAGTCLAGIVAAKIGAKVTISDSHSVYNRSNLMKENIEANDLKIDLKSNDSGNVSLIPLTWGVFDENLIKSLPFDYIIASDCFYDQDDFDDIFATISFIFNSNPSAIFYSIYQIRNSEWNIDCLLQKWNLGCEQTDYNQFSNLFNLNNFSFLLLKIFYKPNLNLPTTTI